MSIHLNSPSISVQVAVGDEGVTSIVNDLLARPARIQPKYFYDALGARLFDAITALPEYYPTRTEAAIFEAHLSDMVQATRRGGTPWRTFVELGCGNGDKALAFWPPFMPSSPSSTSSARAAGTVDGASLPPRYVGYDFATAYLAPTLARLQDAHPGAEVKGVCADFAVGVPWPAEWRAEPALIFYPGSSIGNFEPEAALRFLRDCHRLAHGGGLLIGVDLVKPVDVLQAAYDDALGVTAAFNLNVLSHVNRLTGADFDITQWKHAAFFDREASRIEMHLEARRDTTVQFVGSMPAQERHFEAGERILTEYSYKWTPEGFAALLREAGFTDVQTWTDDAGWFAVMLAT